MAIDHFAEWENEEVYPYVEKYESIRTRCEMVSALRTDREALRMEIEELQRQLSEVRESEEREWKEIHEAIKQADKGENPDNESGWVHVREYLKEGIR
jgi:vacuolar-type H+-ATPase subunit D/Vma8